MSFFNDDDNNFFKPISFQSASDKTSSWAFESSSNKSADGFNPFSPVNTSSSNDSGSKGNFFSSSDNKESNAWGSFGYNSLSKDQDVSILKQQSEDSNRFGHWTSQTSYLEADNAIDNLESKDWSSRFGNTSWAYEKEKSEDNSNWAFETSSKDNSSDNWAFSRPKEESESWAFKQSENSSSWSHDSPKLERWGYDSVQKGSNSDNFNFFARKTDDE
jgi:hypothetical protein